MLSILSKYQRLWAVLGICFLFGMGGVIVLAGDIALTGGLMLFTAFAVFAQHIIRWIFRKKSWSNSFAKQERKLLLIWCCLISISGSFEAFERQQGLTIIFIELTVFLMILGYKEYYAHKSRFKFLRDVKTLNMIWIALGVSFVLMIFISIVAENDDLAEMLLPFYLLTFISLSIYWLIRQLQELVKLKREKSQAELMHLKSQVNPHFFFNILNSLYGLVDVNPEIAKALILKLSDMMRYSIYEGENDWVNLEDEVDYLQNYIELHKMRYHKHIDIEFNVDIEASGYKIMPLLLIILLENAFKHGVEQLRVGAFVKVNLLANQDYISFSVENNFLQSGIVPKPGIGLDNLKKRLDLVYKNRHSFSSTSDHGVYKVELYLKQVS